MSRHAGAVLSAVLAATSVAADVNDLNIQGRVADDGLTVEFVVSNPDPVAYRCSSIHVDTLYGNGFGNPPVGPFPSAVEDVVIAAQQTGQVFRQSDAAVAALRAQFPLVDAVQNLGQIGQFCEADSARFTGALILDDQSSCGDSRTLSKIYSVDTQTGRLSNLAPPAVWQFEDARIWASESLPVTYALDTAAAQPVLHALALTPGALAPRGQVSLPAAPRATNANNETVAVALAGAAFVGPWLALVYSPYPSQGGETSEVVIDRVALDAQTGAPGAVDRVTVKTGPIGGQVSELFLAKTIAGDVSLFLVPAPTYPDNVLGGVPLLSNTPVDVFDDLHGQLTTTARMALRIDVTQGDGPPEFVGPSLGAPAPITDWAESFRDMVTLRAVGLPEPSEQATLANYGLALASGTGTRDLQLLSLQGNGGLPVLSDRDAGFCDARILAVAPQAGGTVASDVNATDSGGRSLLFYAAASGNAPKVAELIARGADVSMIDLEGFTPATLAVAGNHGDVLDLLLAAGADTTINVPSPVGPPTNFVFYALSKTCDTCLEPLQKAGVPLDPVQTPQGTFSLEQFMCGQALFAQEMLNRRFPSDEFLQNMPADQREKLKAERDAYLALDTREDRIERMVSALSLTCTPP